MAQLKDLLVNGASRLIGDAFVNKIQITTINAPTSSGGTTYGPGTSGQVLKSNGTSVYWTSDNNSVTGVKGNSESSYRTGNVNITAANIGLGNVENTKLSTWAGSTAITTLGTITTGTIPLENISDAVNLQAIEALTETSGFLKKTAVDTWTLDTNNYMTSMFIAIYNSTSYADVLAAYQAQKMVYCRVDKRMAFLAYVNNATTPTEFEFQYYRSVATHTDTQQGDQVFVYKLNSSGTWSTTTREAYTKIAAGTNMSSSYSNGVLTLTSTNTWKALSTSQAGYVAQAPDDTNKFLRGDATWATIQASNILGLTDMVGIEIMRL